MSTAGEPRGRFCRPISESDNERSSGLARNRQRTSESSRDKDTGKSSTTSSDTESRSTEQEKEVDLHKQSNSKLSTTSSSIQEDVEEHLRRSSSSRHSESDYSEERGNGEKLSTASESEQDLLSNSQSESSSEKIVTDVEIVSPKDGKLSSSTDEELLQKFREQQANRRPRPRSAKLKYKREVEPETVEKVRSGGDTKVSSDSCSSSDSSSEELEGQRDAKRPRKQPNSLESGSSGRKRTSKIREGSSSNSRSRNSDFEQNIAKFRTPSHSSESTLKSSELSNPSSPSDSESETSTLQGSVAVQDASARSQEIPERPPSRLGRRSDYEPRGRVGRPKTRSKSDKKPVEQILRKKAKPLPTESRDRDDWPKEPGFWWPYNEDCVGDRELKRLISYHKRKLNNLLAQEYLQRHLEIELQKAGAQFKRYDRGPKPIPPQQVRRYLERQISWIYLDGNIYNLEEDSMGAFMAKDKRNRENRSRKARSASKSLEVSSKSSEKSKRSVSFEKGSGRRKLSRERISKSKSKRPSQKGRRDKKKHGSKDSRNSSLSSRESSSRSRDSSRSTPRERERGSRSSSGSRSRNSSKSSKRSSSGSKKRTTKPIIPERPKTAFSRPKSAKPKRTKALSLSGSSTETSANKRSNERSSSTSGTDNRSKSRESSRKDRSRGGSVKETNSLPRVLFTEDFEKQLQRSVRRKSRKVKDSSGQSSKTHTATMSDRQQVHQRRIKAHPPTYHKRPPQDDYDIHRDVNIPGHAFPQYYLAQLMSNRKKSGRDRNRNPQYVLLPAPVNRPPPWKTYSTRQGRPRRTISASARTASPPKPRKKKTKCVIQQDQISDRSSSRESTSSSRNNSLSHASHQRIRPGSGPIKCSWKPNSEPDKPKYEGSDHQLKNTDNPSVLTWLKRKDAQLRARRQDEIRKQRKKTARLIDEQNDLEDKHERALKQYEIWKKKKDREILLRRRMEVKEANSASFSMREGDFNQTKRTNHGTYSHLHPTSGSTFSELRSSSARPTTAEEKAVQRKQRPKSAHVPGISYDAGYEIRHRPRSATAARASKRNSVNANDQEAPQSLLSILREKRTLGEINAEKSAAISREMLDQPPHDADRAAYDKFVRSSSNGKRTGKRRKQKALKELPTHNHADNDLISSLAKRRIDNILANQKRVYTGLKKRPSTGAIKSKKAPATSDSTRRKWKLRDDDVIKPRAKVSSDDKISSSSSDSSESDEERVKFSFRKKSRDKTRHHRNPVVREAVNLSRSTDNND